MRRIQFEMVGRCGCCPDGSRLTNAAATSLEMIAEEGIVASGGGGGEGIGVII